MPKKGKGMVVMETYGNKLFWLGAVERAVKTAAQTLLALIGTGAMSIIDVDWAGTLGVTCTAVVLSVLTSVAMPGQATYTTNGGSDVS